MAERIVIDASVGIAHLREEVGTPAVDAALRTWTEAGAALVVPPVFWIEILNVLGTRHRYTAAQVAEACRELDELGIETLDVGRPELLLVADTVERLRISAYDATYLVLAHVMGGSLATLDRRLAAVAGSVGLVLGDPGAGQATRETPAGYPVGPEARWPGADRRSSLPDYAGLGAYLGELRRRALAGTA